MTGSLLMPKCNRLIVKRMQRSAQAANRHQRNVKMPAKLPLTDTVCFSACSVANGPLAGNGMIAQHGPGSTLGATVNLGSGGADITVGDTRPLVVCTRSCVIATCPRRLHDLLV